MQFQFSFKHMESSPSLQNYAKEKFSEKIQKFVTKPIEAHVIFSLDGNDHETRCSLTGGDGFNIEVNAASTDMYATIDLASDKLVTQLKKHKDKLKHHKGKLTTREISLETEREKIKSDFIDAGDIVKFEKGKQKIG